MTRKILFALFLFGSVSTYSQIEIDKSIQLTGSNGDRAITNLEAPVAATDAVNKAYVDNAVAAGGGWQPAMISDESANAMSLGDALRYCKALTEGGYNDWRLPDFNTLLDALSTGGLTVSNNNSTNYIWFKPTSYGSTMAMLGSMRISDGEIDGISISPVSSSYRTRCVR
ncbi:MAG: hypothetical protein IT223_04985 [Crocinitomicaceae bacterium]|nr:hypothetical protein [Crocinitomicaceae bacterium]